MFGYNSNYNVHVPLLGFTKLWLKGATKSQATTFMFLGFALNVGLLFGFAWLFQLLWAWYVPAMVPMLPHAISYWHAFVTTLFLWAFMPKSNSKN